MVEEGRDAVENKVWEENDAAVDKAYSGVNFRRNKYLRVGLVILTALLIITAIVYAAGIGRNQETAGYLEDPYLDLMEEEEPFSVLPKSERVNDEDQDFSPGNSLVADPFQGPIYLVGVIQSSTGNLAIIETEAMTYVAACGDSIADIWILEIIEENSVFLKADEREMWLELYGSEIIDIQ